MLRSSETRMNEILMAASDMLILQNDRERNAHEQNAQGERKAEAICSWYAKF